MSEIDCSIKQIVLKQIDCSLMLKKYGESFLLPALTGTEGFIPLLFSKLFLRVLKGDTSCLIA